ncbi:MAG: DMT family transporter [Thermodesulfobacteriota bacterium]
MANKPFELSGAVLVMIGAAMISFSGVFVKVAHVTPTAAAFYRVLFGGLILTVLSLASGERFFRSGRLFFLALFCGLFFTLDLIFWHYSVRYVGPGLATILANFQVFGLALYGVLIVGERLTLRLGLSIPLALFGLIMLVGFNWRALSAEYRAGLMFGLLTALAYTFYLLALRRSQSLPDKMTPLANMAVVSLTAAVFAALEMIRTGNPWRIPDAQSWAALLAYGCLGQVLGWVSISKGLPRVPASRAGLILMLQPALAFIWDVSFFGRSATLREVSGAVLAIAAIYLGSTARLTPTPKG